MAQHHRSNKKKDIEVPTFVEENEGQLLGKVIAHNGGKYLSVMCSDNKKRIGFINNKLRFKHSQWMSVGDIILVSKRDYDDSKCDIICKFTWEQAMEIIKNQNINLDIGDNPEDKNIIFENEQKDNDIYDDDIDAKKRVRDVMNAIGRNDARNKKKQNEERVSPTEENIDAEKI